MATKKQASALYRRFFPESRFADIVAKAEGGGVTHRDQNTAISHERLLNGNNGTTDTGENQSCLSELADQFAGSVPEDEFSTAELQGYLLLCKMKPLDAVSGIDAWIEQERAEKRERAEREENRKEKLKESRLKAKAAMVAEFVGPLQQQTSSANGSSFTANTPDTLESSANPTPEPGPLPQPHGVAQLADNSDAVSSPKINGVRTLDP
jgi:hypothetical protein